MAVGEKVLQEGLYKRNANRELTNERERESNKRAVYQTESLLNNKSHRLRCCNTVNRIIGRVVTIAAG